MAKKAKVTVVLQPESEIKKTVNVNDVRKVCQHIGDNLTKTYDETGDLKAAAGAVSAYGTAIAAVKAQLIYKKMTSSPARIAFLDVE